jgi:hypothetical protein
MRRANMASAFHYFTGLQYLVATDDEVGVSATSQKTSALPFCRNMPAPPPGSWVTPVTVYPSSISDCTFMVCADTAVCVAANAKAARGAMFRLIDQPPE